MADAIVGRGLIRIHPSGGGPVAALRGLDLRVAEGEVAAVVGPSGSGKSTLLRLVAGLDRASAGRLEVLGVDLTAASPAALDRHRRERVGVVEQHYRRALSPYLPAAEAIALPLALRGMPEAERRRRVEELLGRVGLPDRGGAYRHQLSGGEQQRIAFAVALAARPALLLADEPTGELDGATAEEILLVLRDLVHAEGTTCLIVTHDELVERVADRVIHVADGRAVAERLGPPTASATRVVDELGWLAPVLPPPAEALAAASRTSDGSAAVRLERIARRYGEGEGRSLGLPPTTAAFRRGGFHVVTGPSGSGKTTLLRIVTGLDRPTEGQVETLDTDLATLDRDGLARFRASRIGMVDQVRDLVPFLSARENVELGLAIRGQDGPDSRDRAQASLERFGLGGHADRAPDGLSAGERLRVALARAMATDPELLVLDEPTAALDRHGARLVAELLAGLDEGRVTILATTHDPALIEAASDRLDLRSAAVDAATPIPTAAVGRADQR
ncbi:MAG TPA: ATP-binding cassette domain-containing protein [Candidatus Saccharimonadales bacterium]|nr:ATP-binding cassette domain-containing protein [Candidatus Saccharimonadales bacterium]